MQTNTNSSTATHLTFFGDSIFDNRPYVYSDEETVGGWASREIPRATSMRAVDGHTTENLLKILTALPEKVDPSESAVISIGGNDAPPGTMGSISTDCCCRVSVSGGSQFFKRFAQITSGFSKKL